MPSSVRDAIIRVLDSSDEPVSLDDIVNQVTLHFPTTSRNSIRTTMLSDGRSRFIQFTDNLYGLASKTYSQDFELSTDNSRITYDERVIALKKFLSEKRRFPKSTSPSSDEISLARWLERCKERKEVAELIARYEPEFWNDTCQKCENYIKSHYGRLPSKDKAPELYKWLMATVESYDDGSLNQEQRKLYLHLKMTIKNSNA